MSTMKLIPLNRYAATIRKRVRLISFTDLLLKFLTDAGFAHDHSGHAVRDSFILPSDSASPRDANRSCQDVRIFLTGRHSVCGQDMTVRPDGAQSSYGIRFY